MVRIERHSRNETKLKMYLLFMFFVSFSFTSLPSPTPPERFELKCFQNCDEDKRRQVSFWFYDFLTLHRPLL